MNLGRAYRYPSIQSFFRPRLLITMRKEKVLESASQKAGTPATESQHLRAAAAGQRGWFKYILFPI